MSIASTVGLVIGICSIIGIVYPHFLYPVILRLARRFWASPLPNRDSTTPEVRVIISCYNEAHQIEECLRSVLSTEYPADRYRITVGDDGSTDRTVEVIQSLIEEFGEDRLTLVQLGRSGKNAVLNKLLQDIEEPIVVFTDADTQWAAGALRAIVVPFEDPSIGGVVARNSLRANNAVVDAGTEGEHVHRKIEDTVNVLESAIASTVWSSGPMYAMRTNRVSRLPDRQVADDWYQLLHAIEAGSRVVFEPRAVVFEHRAN